MTNSNETKIELLKSEMAMIKEQNDKDHAEIKGEIKEVKNGQVRIEGKLDRAIECKADKADLKTAQDDIKKINDGLLQTSRNALYQTVGLVLTSLGLIISLILAVTALKK